MLQVEEKQLKRLQNISKIIGLLSFAAFIILLVFLGYQSYIVKQEISTAENELANKTLEINGKQAEIESLDRILANKENQINAQENTIKEVFKELPKNTINKALKNNPAAAKSLPRVFLHIADESERPAIEKVSEKLQIGGYVIPKVEIVGEIAPKTTQLRYCTDKVQQEDLDRIKQLLKEIKITVKEEPIPPWIDCSKVAVRSYEFWLASAPKNQKPPDQSLPVKQTKKQ